MSTELNEKVYALQYDPQQILSMQGSDTTSFIPNTGKHEDQKYIVVHKEEASISSENAELSVLESIKNAIYPGAIVVANRALMENAPAVPAFDRAPMTFHIDLPGMGKDGQFTIDNPTQSALETKIDEKFTEWCDKYSKDYQINAVWKYREAMAHSESQLSAALNLNYKTAANELGIDFKAINNGEKSVMIFEYEQVFFTVKCDKPTHPSEFFADSVTWEDLQAKGISDQAPPAYVQSVNYGRRIFIKMETSSHDSEVEAALRAAMGDDFSVDTNASYKDILKNTSISVIVLGGGVPYTAKLIEDKELKDVRSILLQSGNCGKDNPGYLFSYTCNFMKDDAPAVVRDSTKYIVTTTKEYTDGVIRLEHKGAYVAYFNVNWRERSYDSDGNEQWKDCAWSGNGGHRTSSFSTEISLAGNCSGISVEAYEFTGLIWEKTRKVIDAKNVPLVPKRTFHISGTTLSPSKSISPSL